MSDSSGTLRIVGVLGTAALALLFAPGGVAAAHVGLSGTSTAAGTSSVLTFSSSHGCDGSPTTEFAIQIPTELTAAAPTQLAGWDVRTVEQQLDAPIADSHGNQITERIDQIVYTAQEPLADGIRVAFEISVPLRGITADRTLYFPTVQRCVQGQNDWIETPSGGQGNDDLEFPAPALQVTAAAGSGGHVPASGHAAAPEPTTDPVPAGGSGDALAIVALAAGIAGVLLGGAALLRGRPRA